MNPTTLYGPPPDTLRLMLNDPEEHDFAALSRLLEGLSPKQAVTVPAGLPYSIAGILAHVTNNMRFNLELIRSPDPLHYRNLLENWPEVTAEGWPNLLETFFGTLAVLEEIAENEQELTRVLFPATDNELAWTVGYKLAMSVAKHNAYHLGQIALLRRLVGA